ncbi:type VII secretion system-associated protein [Streptomyces sp. NPDC090025]|uniref:type VII secretion system-associated protein n=1 Tax=Streptomyces sp. NPDC090025 TaxID=3365922 RepID=UPI0038367652
MPTDAQLTKLDSPAIQAFINGPLAEFFATLEALGKDSGTDLSPRNIARGYTNPDNFTLVKPLAIGIMTSSDNMHGQSLNGNTQVFTESIDKILTFIQNLSQEIEDTLLKMIEEFLKKQGGTLDDIKAQEFLNTIKSAGSPKIPNTTGLPDDSTTTGA